MRGDSCAGICWACSRVPAAAARVHQHVASIRSRLTLPLCSQHHVLRGQFAPRVNRPCWGIQMRSSVRLPLHHAWIAVGACLLLLQGGAVSTAAAVQSCGAAFAQVATGRFHTCGIRDDGSIQCWGIALRIPPSECPVAVCGDGAADALLVLRKAVGENVTSHVQRELNGRCVASAGVVRRNARACHSPRLAVTSTAIGAGTLPPSL